MIDYLYWIERAHAGDSCADAAGNCYGCGRPVGETAEGAADGCGVCNAWLDWYGRDYEDDDDG